ncbi:MAG: AAA family ATPase [Desulfosarcina sp.]|nr:AAA family ATPase [Desulfosarcina sp.]MBC2743254.1 AAA family ATPase [Desulfosarcina sp.]MBC2766164.1 AAA family ATPase [Desulfosarcina sp.]
MYLNHYHLKAKPFDLSPGPHFLWLGEKHNEALATLNYGIKEDLGFLLLTGDVGVGKTALIHRLINNLDSSTIVAYITDPGLGTLDFFKLLAAEFNIPIEFHSKGEFLIELEKFLYNAYSDHKKVLLIVDEAQRLNNKLLDQIRVLSNIELSDRKLINIFFVGQPEFKNMLMANSNRAIRQRIAINYHIDPLTESETGQYIEHRLKVAGATRKIFKSNAFREIFRFTGGYPRTINNICNHALLTGYESGSKSIDSDVIKECEQELNIRAGFDFSRTDFQTPADTRSPSPRRSPFRGYPILIGICILLGAFMSYYLLWPATRWTMKPITQKNLAESSNHQTDTVENDQLKLNEKIEKEQTQASSKNEIALAQPSVENGIQVKAAPKDEIAAADLPPAAFTAQANPAPDKLPNISEVESGVIVPGKAQKDLAWLSAPSDAKPGPQPDKATQKVEIKKQDALPSKQETTVADRQPVISTDPATPAPDKSSAKPEVESGVTLPAKSGKNVALIAALPDAKPNLQLNQGARISNSTGKSEITALKSGNAKGSNAAESKSKAKASSSLPTTEGSSRKANSDNQNQVKKNTVPEKVSPGNRPEPPIIAKAETQLQPSAEQIGGTAPAVKDIDNNSLENRLRSFLQNYCSTYAAKDLDAFTTLFAPGASENGKPFEGLLPKYQRNFKFIETIQYRIELQQFSYDDNREIVKIDGNFFLKWLPPDKKWRENSGIITMSLRENGASFLVHRLDYHGNRSKKK